LSAPAKRVVIHDTGSLISGTPMRLPLYTTLNLTTPGVVKEVRDKESSALLERMLSMGILSVEEPSQHGVEQAWKAARRARVERRLSRTDIEVLALAIDKAREGNDVMVATDDYALQEAARKAGLRFLPIRYRGIR